MMALAPAVLMKLRPAPSTTAAVSGVPAPVLVAGELTGDRDIRRAAGDQCQRLGETIAGVDGERAGGTAAKRQIVLLPQFMNPRMVSLS